MSFFNNHVHSEYSNIRLLDAIGKGKKIIDTAVEQGLLGIAFTDHENLSIHPEINEYAKEIREKYPNFVIGLGDEIYLVDERKNGIKYYHFILIAKNERGHRALNEISSLAWFNMYSDRGMERVPITKEELSEIINRFPGTLIATTACLGSEISQEILALTKAEKEGNENEIYEHKLNIHNFISYCKNLFKDDFYLECQPAQSKEQVIVNKRFLSIAKAYDLKITVATDAHYIDKNDRWVHKSYLNSKGGERETDSFYEYTYMQSPDEVIENLSPSYDKDMIKNIFQTSSEIAQKIEFYDLSHKQSITEIPVKNYPKIKGALVEYEQLSKMYNSDNIQKRYWVNQCVDKLKEKGLYNEKYLTRLEEEAETKEVISEKLETNMFAYPITLQHYIDLFWDCGSIVGAGRGSSCSGLNHYLLGVTQLDPIKHNLPWFRYMNRERIEIGDIDLDLAPSKRPLIIKKIREERKQYFNEDVPEWAKENLGCVLVATFGTETAKSAILTACRGYRSEEHPDGIDVDEAQYISSLVPQERGFLWSLHDVVYGNPDKDRKPVAAFVREVNLYPGLLDIMLSIEGIRNKRSSHASGVILFEGDPFEHCAFMRTPKGELITQYDLHRAEMLGMTKYDFLVTEIQDKLGKTIELLQKDNVIDSKLSLREAYNKYFEPESLPINESKYWDSICNQKVLNLFQFDSLEGSKGIAKIQPRTIEELSDTNGLIRLMGDGEERPIEKYARQKKDISLWYAEMDRYGLTKEEQKYLEPYFKQSYGVPPSQEQMMLMLMDKHLCGFSLKDANKARKIVGKKKMSEIPALHQKILESAQREVVGRYIWERGVGPQVGYSFSCIHALAYSFIGFQTAFAATYWDSIYWNTACLIVNSGGTDPEKGGSTDYAKTAKAIGDITSEGIKVSLVDINSSQYDFVPDVKNNQILYGLKGLNNVGDDVIKNIIANRPYSSVKDFIEKVKPNKTVMISLIRSGAFDKMENRMKLMGWYIWNTCDKKNRLTLQNMRKLILEDLVPSNLSHERAVFEFNRYLKAVCKFDAENYKLDERALSFIENNYLDLFSIVNYDKILNIKQWDKIYQKEMDGLREWLKKDGEKVLFRLNEKIFNNDWNKYVKRPNYSSWEMESMCFYFHEHELKNINNNKYGLRDYESLSREPIVAKTFEKGGRTIRMYSLCKIIGTVIAKDKNKSVVYLLTRNGTVVPVKFRKDYFTMFDRQISQLKNDGKKKVVEKSWFQRGSMIVVNGMRQEDSFVAKKYASQGGHTLYRVSEIDDFGNIMITSERAKGIEEEGDE